MQTEHDEPRPMRGGWRQWLKLFSLAASLAALLGVPGWVEADPPAGATTIPAGNACNMGGDTFPHTGGIAIPRRYLPDDWMCRNGGGQRYACRQWLSAHFPCTDGADTCHEMYDGRYLYCYRVDQNGPHKYNPLQFHEPYDGPSGRRGGIAQMRCDPWLLANRNNGEFDPLPPGLRLGERCNIGGRCYEVQRLPCGTLVGRPPGPSPGWNFNWRGCNPNMAMDAANCGMLTLGTGQMTLDAAQRCYFNPEDPRGAVEFGVGAGTTTFFAGGTLILAEGAGLTGLGLGGAGTTLCTAAPPVALCAGTFAVSYGATRCADNASGGRLSGGVAVSMCAVYDTALNACWRWTPWGDGCNYDLTRNCQFSDPPRYSPRPLTTPCQGGNPTRVDPPYEGPAHGGGGGGGCAMGPPSGRIDGGLALLLGVLLAAWWWRRRRLI